MNAVLQQLIRKYNLYIFDQYGEKTIASRLDYWQNMNLSVEEMVQLVKENMIPLIRMHDSRYQNDCMDCSRNSRTKRSQQLLEFNDVLQNLKSAFGE